MPLHPPPIIASGLGLVTQRMQRTDSSVVAEVTGALVSTSTPSTAVAQTMVNSWQTRWNAAYTTLADSEVQVLQPTIVLGDGTNIPFEATATGAIVNGANVAVMNPPQVAALIKKTTGAGGRQNRGRMYLPYTLQNNAVSETGTLTSGTISSLQTSFNAFLAGLSSDLNALIMSHRVFAIDPLTNKKYVTHINAGLLVNALIVESMCATQRRRLGR
jgi:hypothetical protein